MFIKNNNQQMRLDDPINNMPKYLTKILKKSWAHTFQKYIFPNINEERFSVLYSDNLASRPNSPVNVIVGLLAIKELFDLTDEELIGSLNFDIRFQYALRTTSFEKQPVSINTLTNFRNRAYDYYDKTGIDLIQQEVEYECNGVSYSIRLKANQNLYKLANHAEYKMAELIENNLVDYAVAYDKFFYQADSWDYPRRVIVKVEKPANQLTYQYTFKDNIPIDQIYNTLNLDVKILYSST